MSAKTRTLKEDIHEMRSRNLWIFALAILIAAGFVSMSLLRQEAAGFLPWPIDRNIGHEAPDFSLDDLAGKSVSLSSFKGRPVLLNFWATWCPYCRKERPHLNALSDRYRGKDLVIISVSIDRSVETVKRFMAARPSGFIVLSDEDSEVASTYNVAGLPTSFLIDRQGIIKQKFPGFVEWKDRSYQDMIDRIIAE